MPEHSNEESRAHNARANGARDVEDVPLELSGQIKIKTFGQKSGTAVPTLNIGVLNLITDPVKKAKRVIDSTA